MKPFNQGKLNLNFNDPNINPPPLSTKVNSPKILEIFKSAQERRLSEYSEEKEEENTELGELVKPKGKVSSIVFRLPYSPKGESSTTSPKIDHEGFIILNSDLKDKSFIENRKIKEIMLNNQLSLEQKKNDLKKIREKIRCDYKINMEWIQNMENNHENLTLSDYSKIKKLKNEYTTNYFKNYKMANNAISFIKQEMEKNHGKDTLIHSSRSSSKDSDNLTSHNFLSNLTPKELSIYYHVPENKEPDEEKHHFISNEPSTEYISEINNINSKDISPILTTLPSPKESSKLHFNELEKTHSPLTHMSKPEDRVDEKDEVSFIESIIKKVLD